MPKEHLPIYQIQDFKALAQKEHYFYFSSFSAHLQEHLFIREPHKHNFYIILYVTQGAGTHTIDFIEYEVKPEVVFFMAPGQVHSWKLTDDADGFVIFFTREFYASEYPHRKLYEIPFFNALPNKSVLDIPREEKLWLFQILQLLKEEHSDVQFMKDTMLSRYLDVLLIKLARIYQTHETGTKVQDKERPLLQRLEKLIDQHFKEHLPVSFYADHLHVTAKQLNATCKRALGKTTSELIQNRILLEAKRLLVHAALTTSQVAAELGYFDNTYFFRFFKKHTGLTPEQFRNANK